MIAIHWTLNYTKGDRRLLLQWMKLTCEVPVNEEYRRVPGLSREKNKKFWQNEKRWNGVWCRWMSSIIQASCLLFSAQFFIVSFDVNLFAYAFFQAVNIAHLFFFLVNFLHVIYTLNVFLLTLIWFFRKKFHYIAGRIECLSNRNRVNNRKLASLLYQYNAVHLEMFAMRDLFKEFIGYNVCHCFALCVLTTFACLFADMQMAISVLLIVAVIGLATIFPFYFADSVIAQVKSL